MAAPLVTTWVGREVRRTDLFGEYMVAEWVVGIQGSMQNFGYWYCRVVANILHRRNL